MFYDSRFDGKVQIEKHGNSRSLNYYARETPAAAELLTFVTDCEKIVVGSFLRSRKSFLLRSTLYG